jgi:import inner membrane translocase subunit TIM8
LAQGKMSSWFGGGSKPSGTGSSSSSSYSSSSDPFGSSLPPPPPPPPSSSFRSGGGIGMGKGSQEAFEHAVLEEQQRLLVTQAVQKLTELCFEKCVKNPGQSLSSSETNCIVNTADRYLDSSVFVMGRLMRQATNDSGSGHE